VSLSPTEAAILAAFGASAITGAVTFSITVYSARRQRDRDEQQRQHERERDADERANRLADERRDRLRGGYQAIVYAASTMHAVAKELQAIWANEPVEVRNERLNAVLQDATGDLGRAVASLALDDGTASVIEGLAAIRGDFARYVVQIELVNRRDAGTPDARREAIALLGQIEAKSGEIERLARSHLAP
jgi:hypothetical protein